MATPTNQSDVEQFMFADNGLAIYEEPQCLRLLALLQ